MRHAFVRALIECARSDARVFLITADLGYSVLEPFAEEFPSRFLNVGIQEQNAVSLAAGMALAGRVPYVYSIVPFVTMRCFEQVRVDVAYARARVRLVGVGAGFGYGPAGATHHSIEDIAVMRTLPGMTVACPGDAHETVALVRASVDLAGPMYLRLGKGGEPLVHPREPALQIGRCLVVERGRDAWLLTTSNSLATGVEAGVVLRERGIDLAVVSFPTVKPLDGAFLEEVFASGLPVFTLEEHGLIGGFGAAIAEALADSNHRVRFTRFGVPDEYTHVVGSQERLRREYGLDAASVARRIVERMGA